MNIKNLSAARRAAEQPASAMKRYIYVEARDCSDPTDPIDHGILLSFGHVELRAEDAAVAYTKGPAVLAALSHDAPSILGHDRSWPLVNDYVIEVP
jgi:hypothetical protein